MTMYKVNFELRGVASIHKLNIEKVTEKTVLTDKGVRYLKECQSWEIFDSFSIAKICAENHTKKHIESLRKQLVHAESHLRKLEIKTESDLK